MTTTLSWRAAAACRGVDPDLFHPVRNASEPLRPVELAAKRVCAGCPVRSDCLDFALVTGQEVGVWGGLAEPERRALRPRGRRQGWAA